MFNPLDLTSAVGGPPEFYHLRGLHDPVSALSHLFGAAAFVVLGSLLLRRGRGDAARLTFLGVYAVACVFLLLMSGLYHVTKPGSTLHDVMLRLDHGAIFVLIAGTFTPIHGLLFRGVLRWGPLVLIWLAAAAGVVLKTAFFDRLAEWLGLTFYVAMGWLGAASGCLLWRRYGFAFIRPLLLGGVAYSVGAAADFVRRPVLIPGVLGSHEFFHLAVLAGALLHWRFTWQFADGRVFPCVGRGSARRGRGRGGASAGERDQ
jgi:channel protein (hemolysin III family)